jgi:hypothetical protein
MRLSFLDFAEIHEQLLTLHKQFQEASSSSTSSSGRTAGPLAKTRTTLKGRINIKNASIYLVISSV